MARFFAHGDTGMYLGNLCIPKSCAGYVFRADPPMNQQGRESKAKRILCLAGGGGKSGVKRSRFSKGCNLKRLDFGSSNRVLDHQHANAFERTMGPTTDWIGLNVVPQERPILSQTSPNMRHVGPFDRDGGRADKATLGLYQRRNPNQCAHS